MGTSVRTLFRLSVQLQWKLSCQFLVRRKARQEFLMCNSFAEYYSSEEKSAMSRFMICQHKRLTVCSWEVNIISAFSSCLLRRKSSLLISGLLKQFLSFSVQYRLFAQKPCLSMWIWLVHSKIMGKVGNMCGNRYLGRVSRGQEMVREKNLRVQWKVREIYFV